MKKLKDLFNLNELNRKTNIRLIILPTTSGTGSEVTCFATIWDTKNKKKLSLNYELLLPDIAIVDQITYKLLLMKPLTQGWMHLIKLLKLVFGIKKIIKLQNMVKNQ